MVIGSDKRLITALGVIADLDIEDDILLTQLEEGIELLPNLKLRLLTQKDREVYEKKNPHHKIDAYSENTPVVELQGTIFEEVVVNPFNAIDLTILALKLLKPGNPYLDGIYVIPLEDTVPYVDWFPKGKILGQQYTWNKGCGLHSNEVDELQTLLKKLSDIAYDKEQWYAIACERFGRHFQDRLPPDIVIDYCIAFEALFLRGGYPKDGLSTGQTIGLGCSMLLGVDNVEREKVTALIQELFKLRNDVVHGRAFKYGMLHHEKITVIESYLRRSLVKLMPQ